MANPRTLTPAAPANAGRQLPDHVTSPGLSKLVASWLRDLHDRRAHEYRENGTAEVNQVSQDILKAAADELAALHAPANQG